MALEERYALATQARTQDGLDIANIEAMLKEYEDAETDEDKAVYAAYKEMAEGSKLISLHNVVESNGTRGFGPKVGIVPASKLELEFHRKWSKIVSRNRAEYICGKWQMNLDPKKLGFGPPQKEGRETVISDEWRMTTMTPPIPPRVRREHDLDDKLMLFEVKQWDVREHSQRSIPPADPLLLEHVTGDMWKVIDAWELSDLEVAVIAGVRRH